ncbi:hypothetical protein Tco_0667383 [Tanacetum coccineum]
MVFLSTINASRFPTTKNQLRTYSNPRNKATIQDGRVIVQQVQNCNGERVTWKGDALSKKRSKELGMVQGENIASSSIRSSSGTDDLMLLSKDYDVSTRCKAVLMAKSLSYNSRCHLRVGTVSGITHD